MSKRAATTGAAEEEVRELAASSAGAAMKTAAEEVAELEAKLAALRETEERKKEAARKKLQAKAQPFLDERNELRGRIEADSERVRALTEELVNMGWEDPRTKVEKVGWNLAKTTVAAIAKKAQRGLPDFAKDPVEWEAMGGGADNPLPPEWLNRVLRALADKLTIAEPESAAPEPSDKA